MSRKFVHEGYEYQLNRVCGQSSYYRCCKYRSSNCPARIVKNGDFVKMKNAHSCLVPTIVQQVDSEAFVTNYLAVAAADLTKFPSAIYEAMVIDLRSSTTSGEVMIPCKKSVVARIRTLRNGVSSDLSSLTNSPHCLTAEGRPFLRRHWLGDIEGHYHNVLIWVSDESLSILRQEGQIFLDGTFRVTPSPFVQCVIVVAFDAATNLNVPCVWALMTSRSEYLYCVLLHELIVLLKYRWCPKVCVVDFEKALLGAVRHEFSYSRVPGCFFHFKQALTRKMVKCRVPEDEVLRANSLLNVLTLIPHNELSVGIAFVQSHFSQTVAWNGFWTYFRRTWLSRYPISMWNISEDRDRDLCGRTNNAIERYNRRLNKKFSLAHPKIGTFVSVIKDEESFFSSQIRGIRSGAIPVDDSERDFVRPNIFDEYHLFKINFSD